jgi:hypothetical protein
MTTPLPDPNLPPHPLDPALRRYFRKQVPDPFPACRALDGGPRPVPPARRPQPKSGGGRVVLAIAAAVLLAVGVLLSSGFPGVSPAKTPTDPGVLKGSTADGKGLLPPKKDGKLEF